VQKKTDNHYVLLHRSKLDKKRAGEDEVSERVFVQVNKTRSGPRRNDFGGSGGSGGLGSELVEIGEEGLPKTGYDYSQHMRETSGAIFGIQGDFVRDDLMTQELPPEIVADGGEELMERDLDHITLNPG